MAAAPPSRLPSGHLTTLAAAALDGAADLIGFLAPDGAILYANRAACDEVQLTRDEVIGAPVFMVLPSLTPELWAQRWQEFRAGGRLRFVDKMRRRDGTLFPVDVHASLVVDERVEYALVVARDISERRRVELALRESVEAFRALAENIPAAVGRHGRDRRILYVNRVVAGFMGRPAEELVGLTAPEALAHRPEAAAAVDLVIRQVLAEGVEVRRPLSIGARAFDLRAVPERSEKGDVVSALVVLADVTEQQELERELRRSHDLLSQVVSSAEEGIVVVDRELRYLVRNRFMEELTGIPSSGLIGTPVIDRPVPQLGELIRYLEAALAGATVRSADIELLVRPGLPAAWVQTTYSPLRDGAGEITGVIMVVHDVTARRKAEREQREIEARMLEAQKLESLGVLAGGVAHDFNNLLVGVLGNASLAMGEAGLSDAVHERLRDIELAARRAADLTRQMLAYAGRGRIAVAPIDLTALVGETAGLVRAAIPRTVRLELDLAEALPHVLADRSQLQQVAMNLIINAGEALGSADGLVRVATRTVELTAGEGLGAAAGGGDVGPGLYVALEVADSGPGMDAETAQRVFEPFFSTKGQGRGLGLSSVLGIVRAHRGALRLESTPGGGTTFRVLLPVPVGGERAAATVSAAPTATSTLTPTPRPTSAPRPTAGPDAPPGPGVRALRAAALEARAAAAADLSAPAPADAVLVLLVEDEEHVARTVRRMLELAGYAVTLAPDGEAALALLAARPGRFAAVVLDLAMPVLGGGEAYRRLRALDPTLPVLVTSGYSDGEPGIPEAGDAHAAFLAKPYPPAELGAALGRLLAAR